MADLSHLERMGRELKCPICLSLLKSAVSLACNHIFCNLCIIESMKSISDCPVCKAPFHRREVRPAPHMDNLVTVFKNMEVAAGVNIFTTQVGPTTKNPGDVENNSGAKESALTRREKPKKNGSNNKMRQKLEKTDVRAPDSRQQEMPSFPAKKRIHLTPFPVSETPVPPKMVSKLANTSNEFEIYRSMNEDKWIAADGHGDALAPFFWLREEGEGDDDASEKPSGQPTADTSEPHFAPCFSDAKDSEDGKSPNKATATSQSNAAEAFDSEMFEWTQRACSPELCSTPLKPTVGRNKLDAIQEKDSLEQTRMVLDNAVPHDKSTKISKTVQGNVNDKRKSTLLAKKGRLAEQKRPAGTKVKHLKKCSNVSHISFLDEVHSEIVPDTAERQKDSSQEDEDAEQKELRCCGRKIMKRSKKSTKNCPEENNADVAEASMQFPTISTRQKIQNVDAEFMGILLPVLKSNTTKNEVELNMQSKTRKRGKQTTLQPKKKHMKLSTDNAVTRKLNQVPDSAVTEAKTHNHKCETSIRGNSSKPSEIKEVAGNGSRRSVTKIQKVIGGSNRKRKRKIQNDELVVDSNDHEVHVASPENGQGKSNQADNLVGLNSSSTKKVPCNNGDKILQKSGNSHSKIICAFCQSSNNTKDSGEMMHYFNGKPVAADYNGGANVIHSHKNCTEWAPDVYFEDDSAINLAIELARSRRIKCCCCGIKGAALGCYVKSCRKSFHFTCAKLIPECRWDNDSFVMLCPLHASSKLPTESCEPGKQTRKTNPKGEPKTPKHCKSGRDMSQKWNWPTGSPCKWVLCCSALTSIEKDIISEFTRLTGVPVSKTWSPAVTHVIASTDENGTCKRTLKFLMGILDGKWILSIEWIKACLNAREPVDEGKFEITLDVHGISGGPRLGRLRAINKDPKLFSKYQFYLAGDFTPSHKGYLQDLVTAAGGTVLHRKPLTEDQERLFENSSVLETVIVYNIEVPGKQKNGKGVDFNSRRVEAQALADDCGAKVVTSSWIIDSIAAFKSQPLT